MKIHEYQAKELFASYGIPVPAQALITKPEEIEAAIDAVDAPLRVVKAQIHAGGRGKAGGVKLAKSREEAVEKASAMLGAKLVTKQSGPEGKVVHKVLITQGLDIEKEYYLSITVDNEHSCLVIIASGAGGTEIEEMAVSHPELIVKMPVALENGLRDYQAREVARRIGIPAENGKEFMQILSKMFALFTEKNCSLVEINPLILTDEHKLVALDAKITFDDNGLVRHPELLPLRDAMEEDPMEVKATEAGLNYVALDGDIGCLVNGAGLAMATMDIIHKFGGDPANFLDVGGSASTEKVTAAFEILLSNPKVHAIMVNIFGGIMKCDIIAQGIVEAAKAVQIRVPLVVRLEGTNAQQGKEIIRQSGLSIVPAVSLADAAHKAVTLAKEGERA